MSDEYFKEVTEMVRSGQYFQEAREWYQHKYLSPVVERAYFILLSFLTLIIIILAFTTLASFFPLKMHKPVFAKINDPTTQYTEFKVLGNRADVEEDPHPQVQKYLLKKFLDAYESYDFRKDFQRMRRNENFVKQLANEDVLNEYKGYVSTNNPDSPILRLREKAILTIEPVESSFNIQRVAGVGDGGKNTPSRYNAAVDFFMYETNIAGTQTTKWRAQISFIYKDIRYDRSAKDFTTMEFKVTSYASEKIQ